MSASFGGRGAKFTIGRTPRVTVGIPGTGMYWTKTARSGGSRKGSASTQQDNAGVAGCTMVVVGVILGLIWWPLCFVAVVGFIAFVRAAMSLGAGSGASTLNPAEIDPVAARDWVIDNGTIHEVIVAIQELRAFPDEIRNEGPAATSLRKAEVRISHHDSASVTVYAQAERVVGELYEELGDAGNAISHYRAALVLDPKVGVKRRLASLEQHNDA